MEASVELGLIVIVSIAVLAGAFALSVATDSVDKKEPKKNTLQKC